MSSPERPVRITGETVRDDFNAIAAVLHYTRAAHSLGLWRSERILLEEYFPDRDARLLEAGCGAGRVAIALWQLGYRKLTAFDFAHELVEQAASLAREKGAGAIPFLEADATSLPRREFPAAAFDGVFFLFNGLMQIPGRSRRRAAMEELRRVVRPGAFFLFTTHDRDDPLERAAWQREAELWARGEQNPRLVEFGDRYFAHQDGNTFMHLPDRREILDDLAATGWTPVRDVMRGDFVRESEAVREFSDNCRFWIARKD